MAAQRAWRSHPCQIQNRLQSEARPYRYWGRLDCHCHSQAPRPQSLVGWGICQRQRPEMTIESLSVRKTSALRRSMPSTRKAKAQESLSVKRRFRTSAWRPSTSSTKKATEHPRWYNLSATAAADVTVAADATVAAAVEVAITPAADVTVAAA